MSVMCEAGWVIYSAIPAAYYWRDEIPQLCWIRHSR